MNISNVYSRIEQDELLFFFLDFFLVALLFFDWIYLGLSALICHLRI